MGRAGPEVKSELSDVGKASCPSLVMCLENVLSQIPVHHSESRKECKQI